MRSHWPRGLMLSRRRCTSGSGQAGASPPLHQQGVEEVRTALPQAMTTSDTTIVQVAKDVPDDLRGRLLDTTHQQDGQGLSRSAFGSYDRALRKTDWAQGHQRRYAMVGGGGHILSGALQCDLTGILDQRPV